MGAQSGSMCLGELEGVSCISSTACTAAGYFRNSGGSQEPLAATWSGAAWADHEMPVPSGANSGTVQGVSCASASACVAAGYSFATIGGTISLVAESWNGVNWTVSVLPNPVGAKSALLEGVACAAATACTAVGLFDNSAGVACRLRRT
jgi:hypothetical protein